MGFLLLDAHHQHHVMQTADDLLRRAPAPPRPRRRTPLRHETQGCRAQFSSSSVRTRRDEAAPREQAAGEIADHTL
jgi:hypothetical protein